MNRNQFDFQMGILRDIYGEKKYPPERTDVFWFRFKDIPYQPFVEVVKLLIASESYPPLLPKFEEKLMDLRRDISYRKKEVLDNKFAKNPCSSCGNSGVVYYRRIDHRPGDAMVTFQCKCELGAEGFAGLPKEYAGMSSSYTRGNYY